MHATTKNAFSLIATIAVLSVPALAGPDWIEDGDAGRSIDDAQNTTSVGLLNTIAGTLGGIDHEDVYKLIVLGADDIASPVSFGFTQGPGPAFNPALWLFDSAGYGVLGNDDDPILGGPGSRLIAPSTDGVTLMLPPGEYFLAVTESGNVPLSFRFGADAGKGALEEIFSFANALEVSGPDGIGADNPLYDWSGGAGSFGNYGIVITPAPASLAILTIAGATTTRRRRALIESV